MSTGEVPRYDTVASTVYQQGLGSVRDQIRQELVYEGLAAHIPQQTFDPPLRVLDVGCGQGTQAILHARAGREVVGVDPAPEMLERFVAAAVQQPYDVQGRITIMEGRGQEVGDYFGEDSFDIALCHGVLAYMTDKEQVDVLTSIRHTLQPGGLLSLLTINGDAAPLQPAALGNWEAALDAFFRVDTVERQGVVTRAFWGNELSELLSYANFSVVRTLGIRALTDAYVDETSLAAADYDIVKAVERLAAVELVAAAPFHHTICQPTRRLPVWDVDMTGEEYLP